MKPRWAAVLVLFSACAPASPSPSVANSSRVESSATPSEPQPSSEPTSSPSLAAPNNEPLIDLKTLWSWQTDPALASAVAAKREGKPEQAAKLVAAAREASPSDQARLLYREALLLKDAGKPTAALARFREVASADSPLASHARLRAAELLAALGRDGEAVRQAAEIDLALIEESTVAQAIVLSAARTAPLAQAERYCELSFIGREQRKPGWALEGLRVLSSLSQRKEAAALPLALRLADTLRFESPRGRAADEAEKLRQKLLTRVSHADRAAQSELSDAQAVERAERLTQSSQEKKAVALLDRLQKKFTKSPPQGALACDFHRVRGKALGLVKRKSEAWESYSAALPHCDSTSHPDLQFQAGRAAARAGVVDAATKLLAEYESAQPKRELADDARLEQVRALLQLGNTERALALARNAAALYPLGDRTRDVLFDWLLVALERNDLKDATAALAAEAELHKVAGFREERSYDRAGRHQYFRGKVALLSGDRANAAKQFERAIKSFPLSYYGALATAQLEALEPGRAGASLSTWLAAEPTTQVAGIAAARAEEPQLKTLFALTGVGDVRGVEDALASLRRREPKNAAWYGVGASLLHLAGDDQKAHAWLRTLREREPSGDAEELLGFLDELPRGSHRELYLRAYPKLFTKELEAAASEATVPPHLLMALAREESAFLPRALSLSDARGLLQVIPPTGSRMARSLGIRFTKDTLFDPTANTRIGARYLKGLLKRFDGMAPLAIAGYNAGPGAPEKWLEERPGTDLDLFVERIPYLETRNYVKRVWSSYYAYQVLYSGDLTPLFGTATQLHPASGSP